MVLNPGKCHFVLFDFNENEQFHVMCIDITLKKANKKLNGLIGINHYMKQSQKDILMSSFIILILAIVPSFGYFAQKNLLKR